MADLDQWAERQAGQHDGASDVAEVSEHDILAGAGAEQHDPDGNDDEGTQAEQPADEGASAEADEAARRQAKRKDLFLKIGVVVALLGGATIYTILKNHSADQAVAQAPVVSQPAAAVAQAPIPAPLSNDQPVIGAGAPQATPSVAVAPVPAPGPMAAAPVPVAVAPVPAGVTAVVPAAPEVTPVSAPLPAATQVKAPTVKAVAVTPEAPAPSEADGLKAKLAENDRTIASLRKEVAKLRAEGQKSKEPRHVAVESMPIPAPVVATATPVVAVAAPAAPSADAASMTKVALASPAAAKPAAPASSINAHFVLYGIVDGRAWVRWVDGPGHDNQQYVANVHPGTKEGAILPDGSKVIAVGDTYVKTTSGDIVSGN